MMNALIGVVSATVTGILLLLGTRFVARQSREVGEQQVEVEQRKVDQEAFDRFITRYESDRQRQEEQLQETRSELSNTRSLFRVALKHINRLRSEMRDSRIEIPPLPEQLESVPWGLLGEEQPPT